MFDLLHKIPAPRRVVRVTAQEHLVRQFSQGFKKCALILLSDSAEDHAARQGLPAIFLHEFYGHLMLDEQAVCKVVADIKKRKILVPEGKAFKSQTVLQFFLHGGSPNNYVTNLQKGLIFRLVSVILKYFLWETTILEAKAMQENQYPVIDPVATGENIVRLRQERGLSVRDLQAFFGFEEPQAIYKWQRGKSLPSVDNLYALGALLDVPMDEILISARPQLNMIVLEQQADACCSVIYIDRLFWIRQRSEIASTIFRTTALKA